MRNIGKRVGSAGQKCANMAGNAVLLAFTRFGLKVLAGVGQSQVCVHRARFIRDNLQKVEWRGWNDLP